MAIETAVAEYVRGVDSATARLHAKQGLIAAGWQFRDDDPYWLDDIIWTNFALRCGWREYQFDRQPVILDMWPAQELVLTNDEVLSEWRRYWSECGGRLYDDQMIALRNDPVWLEMSEFGLPFAPFTKAGHVWTRLVSRQLATSLGLIDRSTIIRLSLDVSWNEELVLWSSGEGPERRSDL